jgi:hypothetical protein
MCDPSSLAAVYNTATEAPEPDQSPRAALRAHTASYATAVTHNTAPPPPSTYAAAASTSSSGGSRRSGSAADMVLAAIQTTRQRAHAKMAGRTRQVGACRNIRYLFLCAVEQMLMSFACMSAFDPAAPPVHAFCYIIVLHLSFDYGVGCFSCSF